MPRRTTLQDVAGHAGVHRCTVSLALRSHPSIPLETRERIRAIAERLGYRPNPLVSALMQARRTGSGERHVVIAYVTNYQTRFGWRPPQNHQPNFFPGAAARAQELGYKLEHFWMSEPNMNPDRLATILWTRNIRGLLIARLPRGVEKLEFDWTNFSAVAFGLSLKNPALHHVGENHFATTHRAVAECLARGYRRVGLAYHTHNIASLTGDRWLGGYLSQQRRLSGKDQIPPYEGTPEDEAQFLKWFKRWRPDALLTSRAQMAINALKSIGYKVPEDVGLVSLFNENPSLGHAGMHYAPERIGALGVDMLVGLLHRSETGVPVIPNELVITGEWLEGWTLPRRS